MNKLEGILFSILILLIPSRGLFALYVGDKPANAILGLLAILFSVNVIYFRLRKKSILDLDFLDKTILIYIIYVFLNGIFYESNLIFKGITSSLVLSMPILLYWALKLSKFTILKTPKFLTYICIFFLVGYLFNFLGINFSDKFFTSSISKFRFSSFYGATTIAGLWSLSLFSFLTIIRKKNFYMNININLFLQIFLLVGAIFSYQRNVYGSIIISFFSIIFNILFYLKNHEDSLLRKISPFFLIIVLHFSLLNVNYYAKSIAKVSNLTSQVFSRIIERSDSSQLQRNDRHERYLNYFLQGNIYEKAFGIYPSIGNASRLIRTNKIELFNKNPESYYLKLLIERGLFGLILFSSIQLILISKFIVFLSKYLILNLKKENYRLIYNFGLIHINFTLLGVSAVLFNLQFLDSALGSLLFALLTNECLSLNSYYYKRIFFYRENKKIKHN